MRVLRLRPLRDVLQDLVGALDFNGVAFVTIV